MALESNAAKQEELSGDEVEVVEPRSLAGPSQAMNQDQRGAGPAEREGHDCDTKLVATSIQDTDRGQQSFVLAQQEGQNNYPNPHNRHAKQEELGDVRFDVVESRFFYFRVVLSGNPTGDVIRVNAMDRTTITFQQLRQELEDDVDLPCPSFQFTLKAGGGIRPNSKQEKKWHVGDIDFDLMKVGDGSCENPYRVFVVEKLA